MPWSAGTPNAPTGSIFNSQSTRIQEIINKSVGVFLPTFDKIWEDAIVSNQGVGPAGDMGRDHLILKTFMGGLTGVIEPGGPGTDWTLYGDPSNTALGSKLFMQGLSRTFPDATQGMNQAVYKLGIPMRSMLGNLMLTLGESQAEASPALIGEVIAPKLEGWARHMSQTVCNYWYTSQNTFYSLAKIALTGSGSAWTLSDSNKQLELNLTVGTSTMTVNRFMVGMRVQIYSYDGGTLRQTASLGTNTVLVVTAVDELTGKVFLRAIDNQSLTGITGSISTTTSQEDIVVMANSKGDSNTPFASSSSNYFTGIAGINSWMKTGDSNGTTTNNVNTLLGYESVANAGGYNAAINVNTHPEFKSMFYSNGGNALTEHTLRKILARFHAAKGKYGQTIDCLIASEGVWLAYLGQKISREYLNRTGATASINNEGSQEGMTFTYDGRTYEGYTSTYIETGTVYGIKKKNNWKRYSPPDPARVKKFDRNPSWNPFVFVAPALTGTDSIMMPISAVGSNRTLVTEGSQLPGMLRMQLVPDQPAGIKITNVGEDRLYADS